MTDKHIITDGCEFQSDCIEYKDISYLKIMPICAIHELSIACHDKVNKCKYYKLYKQLKAKEQECEGLKKDLHKNFEEKDKLHLIIDRLLEASGYDTNTASAEDFEDVYENMRYEKQQLYQLKAENDGLKTMLKDLSYENQKFCYQIEEQTKQLEPFKDEYFKGLDNVAIAKLAKKSIRITAENSKLEQTLIEIKEIVENMNEECFYDDFDCMNCDMQNGCTYFNKKQILQKISEVENDNK